VSGAAAVCSGTSMDSHAATAYKPAELSHTSNLQCADQSATATSGAQAWISCSCCRSGRPANSLPFLRTARAQPRPAGSDG
jgi:hypothetical protein